MPFPRSWWLRPGDQLIASDLSPETASAYLRIREDGAVEYLCFRGRASKPCEHFRARNREHAVKMISQFYCQVALREMQVAARRKDRQNFRATAKANFRGIPGSIFVQSWGWEQTNITCFQMIRRISNSKIEAVEIGLQETDESAGPMSDHCQPVLLPMPDAEKLPRIVMTINGVESVRVPGAESYSWGRSAELWDGKRSYYRRSP
jgi:hypothetical protein